MSKVIDKVWGTTECVIANAVFEKHRLDIKPGHRCSLHRHKVKWNSFTVISGRLFIDVYSDKLNTLVPTELGPGDSTTVGPGVFHQFRTGAEPCLATEEYYTETLSEDIERLNQGGPVLDDE